MGMFTRFSDIFNSNINALLDKAEEPKKLLKLMIVEMESALSEARTSAASLIASKKTLQRQVRNLNEEAQTWAARAELALERDKEDLARAALKEKNDCLQAAEAKAKELHELELSLNGLESDVQKLQGKLNEALAKQQKLNQQYQILQKRQNIRQISHQDQLGKTLAKLEGFEKKLDRLEAEVESYDIGQQPGLAEQIDGLVKDEELDVELEALKQKMKKAS